MIKVPCKVEGTRTGNELLACRMILPRWNRHYQNDSEVFNRPKPCGRKLVLTTPVTAVRFLVGGGGSGRILGMCRAPFGFMCTYIGVCRAQIMRGSSVREEGKVPTMSCHIGV